MNNKEQSWLAWGAAWAGYATEVVADVTEVVYEVTIRDYENEPVDDISEEIRDLVDRARDDAHDAVQKENPTDHDVYVNLRPQLLQAIDNVISRSGEIKNEDLESWWGIAGVVGNQLMHPLALALTATGGALVYDELTRQVNAVHKAKNPGAKDISITEATSEEIMSTSLVHEMMRDEYVFELLNIKKDSFKTYLSNNKEFAQKYLIALASAPEYTAKEAEAASVQNWSLTQVAFENPKMVSALLELIMDLQPEVAGILKDPETAKAVETLTGISSDALVKVIIPKGGKILQEIFVNLEDKAAFADFMKNNRSALEKLMGAQSGKNEDITEEEFAKLVSSFYELLRATQIDTVLANNKNELVAIVSTYLEQVKNPTLQAYGMQDAKGKLTPFGKDAVSLGGKLLNTGVSKGTLTEDGQFEFAEFITNLTFNEKADVTAGAITTVNWLIDKFSSDPELKDDYERFMKTHETEVIAALDVALEGNRWVKGNSKQIYNLIKNRDRLGEVVSIYRDYEKGNYGSLFKQLIAKSDLRAVVITAAIEGIKYFLREGLYPNSFRRLLLNNFANNLLENAVEFSTQEPQPEDPTKHRVDFAKFLDNAKKEGDFKGIQSFMIAYRSFKGLIIKHDLVGLEIDGFNFNETKFPDRKLVIDNCKLSKTTFDRVKVKSISITNSSIDVETLLSLMPKIEELGSDKVNLKGVTIDMKVKSPKAMKELEIKFAEFGKTGEQIFKDHISPGDAGRSIGG